MKGQIFIVLAMVLVAILVGIRASLKSTSYSQNKIVWETNLNNKIFENIFEESKNVVDFVYPNVSQIVNKVGVFYDFIWKKMGESGKKFKGVFVFVTPNSSESKTQVDVLNYLGKETRFIITVNGVDRAITVAHNSTRTIIFNGVGNVIISYENYNETILVYSNKYSSFFDERLISEDFELRKKGTKSIEFI